MPSPPVEYGLSDEQKSVFDEPSRLTVIEHTYVANEDRELIIVTMSADRTPQPRTNAAASRLAAMPINTKIHHLPLDWQEKRYARRGIHLSGVALPGWKLAAELVDVPLSLLPAHLFQVPCVHVNDTLLPWPDEGRKTGCTPRPWRKLGAGQREENGFCAATAILSSLC